MGMCSRIDNASHLLRTLALPTTLDYTLAVGFGGISQVLLRSGRSEVLISAL